jgi:hypothetical protein
MFSSALACAGLPAPSAPAVFVARFQIAGSLDRSTSMIFEMLSDLHSKGISNG